EERRRLARDYARALLIGDRDAFGAAMRELKYVADERFDLDFEFNSRRSATTDVWKAGTTFRFTRAWLQEVVVTSLAGPNRRFFAMPAGEVRFLRFAFLTHWLLIELEA